MASDRIQKILLFIRSSTENVAEPEDYAYNCWDVSSHTQDSDGKIEGRLI
jgi:hypothetical protein